MQPENCKAEERNQMPKVDGLGDYSHAYSEHLAVEQVLRRAAEEHAMHMCSYTNSRQTAIKTCKGAKILHACRSAD